MSEAMVDLVVSVLERHTLRLTDVIYHIPANEKTGKRLNPATPTRWAFRGKRLKRDGSILRLKAWRLGQTWYTSLEDLNEFIAALTADSLGVTEPVQQIRTPAQRSRASAAANAELERLGA